MEPVLAALGSSWRLFVQRGGRFGKRIPELVRGTTFEDLKTAKKRAEQGIDIVAGNKERQDGAAAADQGPQSRRRLAPLSLRAESNPEAAHGSLDADALPFGLLRRVFFGVLPTAAASGRASEDVAAELRRVCFVLLPSAAASSLCWEDVAAELLARFASRAILEDLEPSRRRKLSVQDIIPSYQRTTCRLILLCCDDTVTITKGLLGLTNTNPSHDWSHVLTELCADVDNTVFVVIGQRKADLAQWVSPCESLGISAEQGYFIRWSRDSPWLYKRGGTTVKTVAEGLRYQGRFPDFILCIADDESEDVISTLCAPSSDSLFPGAAEVFTCAVGDKESLAEYYLEDRNEVLMMFTGLVNSLAQLHLQGGLPHQV